MVKLKSVISPAARQKIIVLSCQKAAGSVVIVNINNNLFLIVTLDFADFIVAPAGRHLF